ARPQRRAGDDRPKDRAERQATQERRGRPILAGLAHVRRTDGPRIATAEEIAIPIQATIEAASRWKSPIVRRSQPSRSARASPAQAPRIDATMMIGSRPPALPRIRTYSDAWKMPTRTAKMSAG